MAHSPGGSEVFFSLKELRCIRLGLFYPNMIPYLCVLLIQEVNNSKVVLECDNVGFGERIKRRQLMRLRIDCPKQVLSKTHRVDLY